MEKKTNDKKDLDDETKKEIESIEEKVDTSPKSIAKLIKRINSLLNEVTQLKAKNRDYEKIYNETVLFLKDVSPKNPLHRRSIDLLSQFSARLEKHEKKKD